MVGEVLIEVSAAPSCINTSKCVSLKRAIESCSVLVVRFAMLACDQF
jgi:hypothetical protein